MSFRDDERVRALKHLGLWGLVLCTACLVVENTVLLSWAAASRPSATLAAAMAMFKVVRALAVPIGLVLAAVLAGLALPFGVAQGGGARARAAGGGHHA